MNAADIDILRLATIINNLICCFIAFMFLFMARNQLTLNKKRAANWFMLYSLFFGAGYAVSLARGWFDIRVIVLANNFIYQSITYLMLFGVMQWYQRRLTCCVQVFAALHILGYTALMYWLVQYVPDSFSLRANIAAFSLSFGFLFATYIAIQYRTRGKIGDVLLISGLFFSAVVSFVPAISYDLSQRMIFYISGIVVAQNVATFVQLGAILSLLFFDEIEWHYQRAIRDKLTGLYNRRFFEDKSSLLFERERGPYFIAIIDIDHFKPVNDVYGHLQGDRVLEGLAELLTTHFEQDLVARFGGEEFAILFCRQRREKVFDKLSHFRKSVAEHDFVLNEISIQITVSIGVSELEGAHDMTKCFGLADEALYQAKAEGRNQLVTVS